MHDGLEDTRKQGMYFSNGFSGLVKK